MSTRHDERLEILLDASNQRHSGISLFLLRNVRTSSANRNVDAWQIQKKTFGRSLT